MSRKNTFFQDGQSPEEQERQARTFLRSKFDGEKKNKWAQQLQSEHGVRRDRPTMVAKRRSLGVWVSSAAAAALLLFGVFSGWLNFGSSNPQQLAASYIENDLFVHQGERKSMEATEELRALAIEQYMSGDFQGASQSWEKLNQSKSATEEDQFYLGLSYLYSDNFAQAIESLSATQSEYDRFVQERKWFLALAYIQAGQLGEGKQLLLTISSAQFNYKKAQNLLKQL